MATRTTVLSDVFFGATENNTEDLSDENLSKSIVDMSLSLETRITAINLYYQKEGDNTIETINKLATIYEISGTKLLRQYLFTICEKSTIEPFLKSLAARALYAYNNKDELAYKALDIVYPMLGANIGTPYKIEFVKMLMINDNYKTKAKDYFCQIIDDMSLECDYRYKTILSLEHNEEKTNKNLYFIREANICFINNPKNKTQYRILAGQYLLQKCNSEIDVEKIENLLLSFAQDISMEYNLRADSADVLLQVGSDNAKKSAKDVIMHLGVGTNNILTLYDNAQNVHTREVEESVLQALEFLQTFELMKNKGKVITVDFVESKINDDIPIEKAEKIKVSFNRIIMDRALYSKYNCTLTHILLQIWTYLTGHKNEAEIKKRLVEELYDMAGTCSSGFASRLVNTISGFGDFSMKISWRDQITANLTGRLNAKIRDMDNLTLQEKVLEEMTIPSDNYELRKHFLKFFRRNMPSIREEMYQEFKEYITDQEYDLYFRTAVSMYETGDM
jgi:hypothetical protein